MVHCIIIDKDNIYNQDLCINQLEKMIVYESGISIKHFPTWTENCPKLKFNLCHEAFGIKCNIPKCDMSLHKKSSFEINKYYKYREYHFPEHIQINYPYNNGTTTLYGTRITNLYNFTGSLICIKN